MPDRPWSGSKTVGRGWTPVTWQEWLLTAPFLAAILAVSMPPGIRHRVALLSGPIAVHLLVVALTGTGPGGNF